MQKRRRLPHEFIMQRELHASDSANAIAAMHESAARSMHNAFPADSVIGH